MADSKISDLAASTTPLAGTELAVIVQGGVTKQVAVSDLRESDNFATADLTLTGNRIHDTNSNNLILSTDGATLNEANIGLTTSTAGLAFGNTYVDVRSTGLTLFENAIERVSVKPTETVINEAGGSYDFRVEGDTEENLLFVDTSTDRVGIGTNTPSRALEVKAVGQITSVFRSTSTTASRIGIVDGNTSSDSQVSVAAVGDDLVLYAGALQQVYVDGTNDRVGIGTNTPSVELDVVGDTKVSGVVQVGEYTVATLPTASTYQAGTIMVSDETGGYTMAFSDGTNWRRTQDRAIVS